MTAKKLKYSNIAELNDAAISNIPTANPSSLLKSVPKILAAAEKSHKEMDEEQAYILYMRYIHLVSKIRSTKEYKRDQKYFDAMLPPKVVRFALEKAESLSPSLIKRYEKRIDPPRKISPPIKQDELIKPQDKAFQSAPAPVVNGIGDADVEVLFMEPRHILNLMKERVTTFLIVDLRDSDDFKESHIRDTHVLTVPGEILMPGITAKQIERKLHVEDRDRWQRRGNVDRLILMDWTTDTLGPESDSASKIVILKDALLKWDTDASRVKKPLFAVKGGFENFGMQYPMHTTNAKKVMAPKINPVVPAVDQLLKFTQIQYPDLDNGFIASASASINVTNETAKSNPNSELLYPSTSDLTKNAAFLAGAITFTKAPGTVQQTRIGQQHSQPPALPDRSTKPAARPSNLGNGNTYVDEEEPFDTTTLSESLSSTIASTCSEMNNAMILESDESISATNSESEMVIAKPTVDRTLKAKAIINMGQKSKNMSDVIEAEHDLILETVQLERKQLEIENRWEVLRLMREKSAEEEMKLEVMKNEDLLLKELAKLLEEKKKTENENLGMIQQLKEIKEQMAKEVNIRQRLETENEKQKKAEAKNAKLEAERRLIQQEIKEKRQLRLQQQHERELAVAKVRIEEAETKRKDLEKELKEKERQKQARDAHSGVSRSTLSTHPNTVKVPLKKSGSDDDEPKSSLNRSHSSPNIAKMFDDEAVFSAGALSSNSRAIPSMPNFTRTNKPLSVAEISQARSRDFQPVWGTSIVKGRTGLKNLGNTCYMNSILQCLSNFQFLAEYFMNRNYRWFINENSETKGNVAIEFSEVIRMLWSGQYKSIAPTDFKKTIGRYEANFRGHEQQDAHELLSMLMSWLHNDINEIKVKVTLPEQKNEGLSDEDAAKAAWELEKKADKSFIRELFYGQWRSTLQCRTCSWASVKYESFFELTLQLPHGNLSRFSLNECIENYLKPESVTYTCPQCKKERDFVKKFDIVKLPQILTVQFVRFYNDGLSRKKQNFVDFGLNDVDFGRYVTACSGKQNRHHSYNLFAVCNHFGSMEGGHYTAYCYSSTSNQWFKYDDHEVSEMSARDVVTPAAYVLFYTTKNKT